MTKKQIKEFIIIHLFSMGWGFELTALDDCDLTEEEKGAICEEYLKYCEGKLGDRPFIFESKRIIDHVKSTE